jgi:hypothetical protein
VKGEMLLNEKEILLNELIQEKNVLEGLNDTNIKQQIKQTTNIRYPNSSDIEIQKNKNYERIKDINKQIKRLEAVNDDKSLTKKIGVNGIPAYRPDDTVMVLPQFTPEVKREIERHNFWKRIKGQKLHNTALEGLSYMGYHI